MSDNVLIKSSDLIGTAVHDRKGGKLATIREVFIDKRTGQILFGKDRNHGIRLNGFEPEIVAKVSKMNLRLYEVPISYYGRTYAEGKKIGWQDGFSALRCIVKYNFLR